MRAYVLIAAVYIGAYWYWMGDGVNVWAESLSALLVIGMLWLSKNLKNLRFTP
jgi:hypothetical protein